MKKIALFICILITVLTFAGCSSSVPDLVGLTPEKAKATLEEQGFTVVQTDGYNAGLEDGVVIAQKPAAGEKAEVGGEVKITVNNKANFGYTYETNGKNATITGIKGGYIDVGDIEIPEKIDGYTVTEIGEGAFWSVAGMTSIKLPDTVRSIGRIAFSDCFALKTIDFGHNLKTIGDSAFVGCEALEKVEIPYSVQLIGEKAFAGCEAIKSVKIGASEIGPEAFSSCKGITELKLTTNVNIIGKKAFFDCSSVLEINIPDSVVYIRNNAFEECSSAQKITVGSGVRVLGEFAFANCNAVRELNIKNGLSEITRCAFASLSSLKNLEIPASVKIIGKNSFQYGSFENVVIQGGVKTIENEAFLNCFDLVNVTIYNSASSVKIAYDAFPTNFEPRFTK